MTYRTRFSTLLAAALLAALPSLGGAPATAQSPAPLPPPLIEARVVPGTPPTLQMVVAPRLGGEGASGPRVVQILLDRDSLADDLIREQSDDLWQDIGSVKGVLRDPVGDPPWFLMRSDGADPKKLRIGIANYNLNQSDASTVSPVNTALRIFLPLRVGDKSLALQVSAGDSIDTLSAPLPVEAPVQQPAVVDAEAKVEFGVDVAAPNALAMGATVTLTWKVADCVQATLSGPIDFRQPVLAIKPIDGVCAGSKKVLALGNATYQLTAELTGKADSRVSAVVTKTVSLAVLRFDQFANLTLTPPSVLPGGKVRARWHIRELPVDDRREPVLSWTDANGKRRLQRLPASSSQTTSGEMSFTVAQNLDGVDTAVRLHYGEETLEHSFDIERWQVAGRSALDTGPLRGMAYAGGRLVLCSEKGLFLSDVGAGGGIGADSVGKVNDPFPDFSRVPITLGDRPEARGPGAAAGRQTIEQAPCLAVRAFDAERVAALVQIEKPAAGSPGYAELTLLSPATGLASYPVTLADGPVDAGATQLRDYQLGMLRGRIIVQVQIGPRDRSTDLNPRSSIRAYSIAEGDIRASTAGWRPEPALATDELRPRYGWHLVDGFGVDNAALFLVNAISGETARYEASTASVQRLEEARASGSPVRLAAARERVEIDFPTSASSLGKEQAATLGNGPMTNVGGVLVAFGAGVAYNPQTNQWQPGAFGEAGGKGSVAAYRGDGEPRLWLMKATGERLSLPVESPRLFVADYFENGRAASLPYLVLGAKVTVRSREALNWRTDRRTVLAKVSDAKETVDCTVKGVTTPVPMVLSTYELRYPDRGLDLIGVSADGKTRVSKAHKSKGSWDVTVSSDPCVTVRVEPVAVAGP
ncbi:hypothetical protein [Ancylobacter sp. FA202]|uniref:hypothetical protein n=1 Tax=Ancylobacter sp. FA202 TaxID=1111106 RepID=UPI000364568F|nr:hypothetical protein [Ancylobacter sp. FA202]